MSLVFFAEGRMQAHDLLGYIGAQLTGAWLGSWAGGSAGGHMAGVVHEALNQPGPHVSGVAALAGEFGSTFALAIVVFVMVSRKSLMDSSRGRLRRRCHRVA